MIDAAGPGCRPKSASITVSPTPRARAAEEVQRMQLLGGAMVARRENVARPFAIASKGATTARCPGMPSKWSSRRPCGSLAVDLFPPAYYRLAGRELDAASGIRALVGTRLASARRGDQAAPRRAPVPGGGREVPARIAADETHFVPDRRASWCEKSGAYWFKLTDRGPDRRRREPLGNPRRARRAAQRDHRAAERPTCSSRPGPWCRCGSRPRTTWASARISLAFTRSDRPQAKEADVPLYDGPRARRSGTPAGLAADDGGERRSVEYRWPLEELKLAAGSRSPSTPWPPIIARRPARASRGG